ncbi:hypothetical protein [Vibrio metschnikovii]|uniref:hypothetical protein n=1 Tax=Vibrio metschnikovii TaxID=28172 RepID=UPI001C2F6049|nr:hypothetical protein [Vibrio metschnikovii]
MVDLMKIIYSFILIFLLSMNANAVDYSPYKINFGEDVIIEIDNNGRVVNSKGSSFCKKIAMNNAYDINSFNMKFGEDIKSTRHLDILCRHYINKIENEYSLFHRSCNIGENNKDVKEICRDLRRDFSDVIQRLEFFSDIYQSVVIMESEKENKRIVSDLRARREEIAKICNERYGEIFENDRLGIDEINYSIAHSQDPNFLATLTGYRFLVFSLPSECKSQERYKYLIKEVEVAKKSLSISIEKLHKKKGENTSNAKSEIKTNHKSTDKYTDKMASYATLLGRAAACKINIEVEMEKVGLWMDSWFDSLNIKNKERSMYLLTFMNGAELHAKQQLSGKSPDSCEQVKRAFKNTRWP